MSSPPPSGSIKPKPFLSLNHLTLPIGILTHLLSCIGCNRFTIDLSGRVGGGAERAGAKCDPEGRAERYETISRINYQLRVPLEIIMWAIKTRFFKVSKKNSVKSLRFDVPLNRGSVEHRLAIR